MTHPIYFNDFAQPVRNLIRETTPTSKPELIVGPSLGEKFIIIVRHTMEGAFDKSDTAWKVDDPILWRENGGR